MKRFFGDVNFSQLDFGSDQPGNVTDGFPRFHRFRQVFLRSNQIAAFEINHAQIIQGSAHRSGMSAFPVTGQRFFGQHQRVFDPVLCNGNGALAGVNTRQLIDQVILFCNFRCVPEVFQRGFINLQIRMENG